MSNCPYCDARKTVVIDSRNNKYSATMFKRRRRLCRHCGCLFTTNEFVMPGTIQSIHEDEVRKARLEAKLKRSIKKFEREVELRRRKGKKYKCMSCQWWTNHGCDLRIHKSLDGTIEACVHFESIS